MQHTPKWIGFGFEAIHADPYDYVIQERASDDGEKFVFSVWRNGALVIAPGDIRPTLRSLYNRLKAAGLPYPKVWMVDERGKRSRISVDRLRNA